MVLIADNGTIICVRWGVTPPKIINGTKLKNMHEDSKKHETPTDANNVLVAGTFENYLIMVGIRSAEYTYEDKVLFENVEYFRRCQKAGLSAYKALLFLHDYINGDYDI